MANEGQAAATKSSSDSGETLSDGEKVLFGTMWSILKDAVEGENTSKSGLAVIVGMNETGPPGVLKDMENMSRAFEKLNLAILELKERRSLEIICLIKAIAKYCFSDTYRFIIFYFSGFGKNEDGHAFIRTADSGPNNMLSIQKKLISPLLPINAPNQLKLRRIFLFDTCVEDDSKRSPHDTSEEMPEEVAVPSYGNVLIAYASCKTSSDRGNHKEGGVWTKLLSKNLERDCPLTTILDLTWEKMFEHFNEKYRNEIRRGEKKDLPCPHYTSSAGLIWLKHPGCSVEESRRSFQPRQPVSTAS